MLKDVRWTWFGLGVLALVVLAVAACSGQPATGSGSTEADTTVTNIKVYESPT